MNRAWTATAAALLLLSTCALDTVDTQTPATVVDVDRNHDGIQDAEQCTADVLIRSETCTSERFDDACSLCRAGFACGVSGCVEQTDRWLCDARAADTVGVFGEPTDNVPFAPTAATLTTTINADGSFRRCDVGARWDLLVPFVGERPTRVRAAFYERVFIDTIDFAVVRSSLTDIVQAGVCLYDMPTSDLAAIQAVVQLTNGDDTERSLRMCAGFRVLASEMR
jgi:hypothetical protein